jgi:DNA-binding LacI/PurR family transcriptional regulator
MHVPKERMGRIGIRQILTQDDHRTEGPLTITIPVTLVQRDSVTAAPLSAS